jgi:hypothetical protein
MRRLLVISLLAATLFAAPLFAATLSAGPAIRAVRAAPAARGADATTPAVLSKGLAELNRHFGELNRLLVTRQKQLERLERYRSTISQVRKQPAGPARDFKLRRLLADARALAKRLSGLDASIRRAQQGVERARRSLRDKLSKLQGKRRAKVKRVLQRTRRARKARVLRVAQPRIHPLDGPRQIEEKADVLKDSEDKIRRRLAEIGRVINRLKKRRKLRSISRRVDRYTGLFNEDSSRRRVTRIRANKTPSEPSVGEGGTPAPAGQADADPSSLTGSYNGDDASAELDGTRGSGLSSGTYAVVLRRLLTPATLRALREASRSKDPATRLQALNRARAELRKKAQQLRRRHQQYRQRARKLRKKQRHR